MTQEELYKQLQEAMNAKGENLSVDGYFGPATMHALAKYETTITVTPNGTYNVNEENLVTLRRGLARQKFIEIVEQKFGKFSKSQIAGHETILDSWSGAQITEPRWVAYAFATVKHETADTFEPVKEYGGDKYLRSKPYWPYIGRGYIQLTWKYNYAKYHIENSPDDALKPEIAAKIMVDGMIHGIFTGKKLSDYFNDEKSDAFNARRIINGLDKAALIASYYETYLAAATEMFKMSEGKPA